MMSIEKIKESINQLENQKEVIKNHYKDDIIVEYYDKIINYLENRLRELEGQTTLFDFMED